MMDHPDLPAWAFAKHDASPDPLFYAAPRFVTHIDDRAVAAVTALYRATFAPGGRLLDLMSSWVSHLPPDVAYGEVVGLGMNRAELDANPRLARRIVQDLNADPALPLATASFEGAACCVSVQYLESPVAVFREVLRCLVPGAPFVVTVSDRCFPTKAVAIWQSGVDHADLVSFYMECAGFSQVSVARPLARDGGGDPLLAVTGRLPA
jgi:SAM-dependent methyltransferase